MTKMFKWTLIISGGLFLCSSVFNTYCDVITSAANQEGTIEYTSKKQISYELQGLQAKLYSNKTLMTEFSKLETHNVDVNMNAKRTIAIGLMGLFSGDIRNLGAPTNGLMKLDTTSILYQNIISSSNHEYTSVISLMKNRAESIREYQVFCANPMNRIFLNFSKYPSIDLHKEEAWGIDNLSEDWLK